MITKKSERVNANKKTRLEFFPLLFTEAQKKKLFKKKKILYSIFVISCQLFKVFSQDVQSVEGSCCISFFFPSSFCSMKEFVENISCVRTVVDLADIENGYFERKIIIIIRVC